MSGQRRFFCEQERKQNEMRSAKVKNLLTPPKAEPTRSPDRGPDFRRPVEVMDEED